MTTVHLPRLKLCVPLCSTIHTGAQCQPCNQRYSLSLGPLLAQKSQSQSTKSTKLTHHQMLFWVSWAQSSRWRALALQTRCLARGGWCQGECWLWVYCEILPPREHKAVTESSNKHLPTMHVLTSTLPAKNPSQQTKG